MTVELLHGDCRKVMRDMWPGSAQAVICSPPYPGQRIYGPDGAEIGRGNLTDWLEEMGEVLDGCANALDAAGTAWFVLGDKAVGCVDSETEALTDRGWKRYDELQPGDRIMTLNPSSYLAEWGWVEAMNVHRAERRRLLSVEGRGHSSLTTDNHRWYVERRQFVGGPGSSRPGGQNGSASLASGDVEQIKAALAGGERQKDIAARFGTTQSTVSKIATGRTWASGPTGRNSVRQIVQQVATSAELGAEDRIPIARPVVNLPVEPKHSDALVEIVAWYYTEGSDRKPGIGRTALGGIYIGQSATANGPNVRRIRAALTALFGLPLDRLPGKGAVDPAWVEYCRADGVADFRLNVVAAGVLRDCAPDRKVRFEWLTELTLAQLELFCTVSVLADGHRRSGKPDHFSQVDRDKAEAFMFACILSGRAATMKERESDNPGPNARPGAVAKPNWVVTTRTRQNFKPARLRRRWVDHDGIVWCPTTNNGSWLARRNGYVYFTGNSGGAGGDFARNGAKEWNAMPSGKFRAGDLALRDGQWALAPERFAMLAQARGWLVRSLITWDQLSNEVAAPAHVRRPLACAEKIVVLARSSKYRWNVAAQLALPYAERGDVWHIRAQRPAKSVRHFAPYPAPLATRMIELATEAGDTVLDPFVGSGTTTKAADALGRNAIGIDLYQHEAA